MFVTHGNIVLQFNAARRVEFDLFQGLSNNIVRLAFALLRGLDGGGLVKVPLVVDIELSESVAQTVNFVLWELRILPSGKRVSVEITAGSLL